MSLGYDVYEDDRGFEKEGLTGAVKRYSTASMEFPCFVIVNSKEKPVKKHSIMTLRRMFPESKLYNDELVDSLIYVYFNEGDKTVRIGTIHSHQVKTFLTLFKNNTVEGYLNKDKKLDGMYLYVLSS